MSPIWVIARKEFMDVLRDRRTLVFMLLLPILVMPVGMILVSKLIKSQALAKESRRLIVGVEPAGSVALRALGDRWMDDNQLKLLSLALSLGLDMAEIGSMADLQNFTERIARLRSRAESSKVEDSVGEAAVKAFRALKPDQLEFLADAEAVQAVLGLTEWRDLDNVVATHPDAQLPPGVELPEHLPPGLATPTIAAVITGEAKELHAALDVPVDIYDQLERQSVSVPITILYDSSQSLSREAYDRFTGFIEALGRSALELRLQEKQLKPGFVEPYTLERANVATDSRQVQAVIGTLLPYLIILFCFFGAFYPSLDLTAGEKERFTLETLLLAPVSRLEIAAGKFVVVFTAAVVAAVLATTSMALTFTHGVLPEDVTQSYDLQFQPLALLLTASLLLPVAALFSSLLLGVSLLARSFKEAQSYATPLQILVIVPALAALLPDLETELALAWVPLMNVSLLMKELLKGNYLWDFYIVTLSTTVVLTCLVLWLTGLLFRRDSVLLRS